MVVPSGTEAARAFIPAKDFDLRKQSLLRSARLQETARR
jgi:hypothetical protein